MKTQQISNASERKFAFYLLLLLLSLIFVPAFHLWSYLKSLVWNKHKNIFDVIEEINFNVTHGLHAIRSLLAKKSRVTKENTNRIYKQTTTTYDESFLMWDGIVSIVVPLQMNKQSSTHIRPKAH